jgi:hypothetical protein
MEQIPSLLINNERINDTEKVADVFSSFFFLSIAENLNLCQVGNEDPIFFLKIHFLADFMVLKLSQPLKLR